MDVDGIISVFQVNNVQVSKLQVSVMETKLSLFQEELLPPPHAIGQVLNAEIWLVQMPQQSIILMLYVILS